MKIYGTVLLTGSPEALAEIRDGLGDDFVSDSYRRNALVIYDATETDLARLRAGTKGVEIEARDAYRVKVRVRPRTAAMIDLMQGAWYKTNQEAFPLLMVRRVRHRAETDDYIFDVDLLNAGNLAAPVTIPRDELAGYGLKPASLEDFEKLDIIPPAGFVPDPHAVPTPETGMESGSEEAQEDGDEPISVSLAAAHIGAHRVWQRLGFYCAETRVVPLRDGYGVEAVLRARYARSFPARIENVPVSYVH